MRARPEPLAAVQFEYHPYLDQTQLLAAVRRHGLAITAYCPIALGKVASDPAPRRDRQEARQERGPGDAPLADPAGRRDRHPETSKPERLKENLAVFDFRLTDEEMDQISRMTAPNSRLINEPLWVPHWD